MLFDTYLRIYTFCRTDTVLYTLVSSTIIDTRQLYIQDNYKYKIIIV